MVSRVGALQIQAAIQAVHAGWPQIVQLYDQLLEHEPTAVVALRRTGPAPGKSQRGCALARARRAFIRMPSGTGSSCTKAMAASGGRNSAGTRMKW